MQMNGRNVWIYGWRNDERRRSRLAAGLSSFIQGLTLILSFISVILIQFSYSNRWWNWAKLACVHVCVRVPRCVQWAVMEPQCINSNPSSETRWVFYQICMEFYNRNAKWAKSKWKKDSYGIPKHYFGEWRCIHVAGNEDCMASRICISVTFTCEELLSVCPLSLALSSSGFKCF